MSGTLDHTNVTVKIDTKSLNPLDLSSPDDSVIYSILSTLSNGTASGSASRQFSDTRTVAPSATDSIDLAGALVDAFGVTITFTKIKLIALKSAAANANQINIARPASNGFVWQILASGGFQVSPGGWFVWFDPIGITVTAATGDLLSIINAAAGTSVTYDLILVGTD